MTIGAHRATIQIALCDDVAEMREILREVLEETPGMEVVAEADNGAECLRLIGALKPDVVVLDLSMPGLDGLEALPLIARRSARTRIVVFSGFAVSRMGALTIARGADRYIEKGAPIDALVDAVREVAGDRRAAG